MCVLCVGGYMCVYECRGCRNSQDSKCPHPNKHVVCVCVCVCVCVYVCVCVCVLWWARVRRHLRVGESSGMLQ